MKRILLLLPLLILQGIVFAQDKPIVVTGHPRYHNQDTTSMFGVSETDKDLCIKKLIHVLGHPDKNTTGLITWNKIRIKGLGQSLQLHVKDGITVRYPQEKTVRWFLFSSEADKQQKLAALTGDQQRDMEMEITDQQGRNVINSDEKKIVAQNFLSGLFAKD